ncbi:MAG TPA: ATP-binding protein, partial [Cellvibrio sp.]|nr:ATP-binding protein [Cellvibrio sp.]
AILNAISSASRVEESIRATEMEPVPLEKVIHELTLAYRDIAQQQVVSDIPANESFVIHGSADLIVQMIDKLFDNACDFCPPEGKVIFSLRKLKDQVVLTVSNDGPLLPQKMQSQLFDSLVSIRDAKDKHNDDNIHLGLGLHIVRLIVEVHHARVKARNRADNSGVEFEVIFPPAIS